MKWPQWQRQQKDKYKTEGGIASEWTQHMGGKEAAKAAWELSERERKKEDTRLKTKSARRRLYQSTLVYPQDLAGNEFYPEAIKFTVFKRKGASLEKIQNELGQIAELATTIGRAKEPAKVIKQKLEAALADLKKAEGNNEKRKTGETLDVWTERVGISARENILEIKSKIDFWQKAKDADAAGKPITSIADVTVASLGKIGNVIQHGTAGLRQNTFKELTSKAETSQIMGEIYMNMPNEINFNEEANWGGTDLGVIGGLAKAPVGEAAMSTAFSQFSNVAGGGTAALGALALKMGKHGAMAGAVLGTLGGEAIQKGLESGTGQVANPYKEMTFSGIGFRQFSFNFTFRARNEKEVEVIQQIIETFRYYSKPTYTHGKSGFFSYPEEFLIEFLMRMSQHGCETYETNHFIPQIKMCVLKTVTTNFSPQNAWRSFRDSSPVEISLALSFEETEVVTGEDIIGETPVGRFKDSGRRF